MPSQPDAGMPSCIDDPHVAGVKVRLLGPATEHTIEATSGPPSTVSGTLRSVLGAGSEMTGGGSVRVWLREELALAFKWSVTVTVRVYVPSQPFAGMVKLIDVEHVAGEKLTLGPETTHVMPVTSGPGSIVTGTVRDVPLPSGPITGGASCRA